MTKIKVYQTAFKDDHNRERIFNGINVVDKEPYCNGKTSFNKNFDDEFICLLKKNGFNLIRLGFTWSAVEPTPGKYNEEFLDSIDKIMKKCSENDIYVYLDMHQDLYYKYCDGPGDGAPEWAALTDGIKLKAPKHVWAEGYFFSKGVHRAFDNFWNNREYNGKGLQDYYADMWKHVATRFKDSPALFGFDFFNEPYPGADGGKVFKKLIAKLIRVTLVDRELSRAKLLKTLLSKGEKVKVLDYYNAKIFKKITSSGNKLIHDFDVKKYSPFINKMSSAVREVTDSGIILMENCYYSNLGIPYSVPPVEVNGIRENQVCFAPHGYDLMVDTDAYKYASNSRVGEIFSEHKRSQERLSMPVVVGEWGGHSSGTEWFPHVEFLLDTFDKNKWSNTYWAYFDGLFEEPLMDILCRPYPQAVTGEIIEYKYDRQSDAFLLEYVQECKFDEPTLIYLHKPAISIDTTCKYEIENSGGISKSSILKIYSDAGKNKVRVKF